MKKIYLLLIILMKMSYLEGQDTIVTVKLKNGEVIQGKILHGRDLNDYYIRLLTENKKIKDIYTTDIVSIKDEKPLMQSSSSGPKVVFIPL